MSDVGDFIVDNGVIIKYVGPGGNVVIPEGVTCIGEGAFSRCDDLTRVSIPKGVVSVGNRAFSYCRKLKGVVFAEDVKKIGSDAFSNCEEITQIAIPKSITSIGDSAFRQCINLQSIALPEKLGSIRFMLFGSCKKLENVVIPNNVKGIGNAAFCDCESLSTITIPGKVKSIGWNAFYGCKELEEILVVEENKTFRSIDGVLFDKSGTTLLRCGSGRSGSYRVPEGVIEIENSAFEDCKELQHVYLPKSAVLIAKYSINRCPNLTIHAPAGSHAEQYAKKNNIPFVAE